MPTKTSILVEIEKEIQVFRPHLQTHWDGILQEWPQCHLPSLHRHHHKAHLWCQWGRCFGRETPSCCRKRQRRWCCRRYKNSNMWFLSCTQCCSLRSSSPGLSHFPKLLCWSPAGSPCWRQEDRATWESRLALWGPLRSGRRLLVRDLPSKDSTSWESGTCALPDTGPQRAAESQLICNAERATRSSRRGRGWHWIRHHWTVWPWLSHPTKPQLQDCMRNYMN